MPTDLSTCTEKDKQYSLQKKAAAENQSTSHEIEGKQITATEKEFTLFLKNSRVQVDINNAGKSKEMEVELPEQNRLLQIYFDNDDGLKIDNTNPSQKVESFTDYSWKEIKLDHSKLPQYYMKLSKIRLTGNYAKHLIG